ncbi:MAG: acyltransferase [Bacteroidales bacterium]|nr:acyltransferase [Bacteroidales bacterium]
MDIRSLIEEIFSINSNSDFEKTALKVFKYQSQNNQVYSQYLKYLNKNISEINSIEQIPFMPIEFFKSHTILTGNITPQQCETVFTSSGTTGINTSRHYVKNLDIYYRSLKKGFQEFYGDIQQYRILALLPAYLERTGSSLVVMAQKLMEESKNGTDGFYLYNFQQLETQIKEEIQKKHKVILIGVTFALLDFAEQFKNEFGDNLIVMETGGMKGRKKEIVRQQVHQILTTNLGLKKIHSEYGMTELLSQAYSKGDGIYQTSSTMKILIRESTDPFLLVDNNVAGGINVIDLANIYSCSFIETKDLGIKHTDNTFEVLGRIDNSDIRGCNLLYSK